MSDSPWRRRRAATVEHRPAAVEHRPAATAEPGAPGPRSPSGGGQPSPPPPPPPPPPPGPLLPPPPRPPLSSTSAFVTVVAADGTPLEQDTVMVTVLAVAENTTRAALAGPRMTLPAWKPC